MEAVLDILTLLWSIGMLLGFYFMLKSRYVEFIDNGITGDGFRFISDPTREFWQAATLHFIGVPFASAACFLLNARHYSSDETGPEGQHPFLFALTVIPVGLFVILHWIVTVKWALRSWSYPILVLFCWLLMFAFSSMFIMRVASLLRG